MWKITHTLTHAENILEARRPLTDKVAAAKMEFLRGYASSNGLIDAREELVSPTTIRKIFIWESQERHEEFKARWASDLELVRAALDAEGSALGITTISEFEEFVV
jgi:hypothetical protein